MKAVQSQSEVIEIRSHTHEDQSQGYALTANGVVLVVSRRVDPETKALRTQKQQYEEITAVKRALQSG